VLNHTNVTAVNTVLSSSTVGQASLQRRRDESNSAFVSPSEQLSSLQQLKSGINSAGPSKSIRVPHVRVSVRGLKKMGEALPKLCFSPSH
jgi:hypothetical protein